MAVTPNYNNRHIYKNVYHVLPGESDIPCGLQPIPILIAWH